MKLVQRGSNYTLYREDYPIGMVTRESDWKWYTMGHHYAFTINELIEIADLLKALDERGKENDDSHTVGK